VSLADKMAAKIAERAQVVDPVKKARLASSIALSARLIDFFGLEPRSNSRVGMALAAAGVSRTSEFERIFNLPRRVLDFEKVEDLTPLFARFDAECAGCPLCACGVPSLWSIQSAAIADAERQGGLFGAMGVGSGKTGTSLLVGSSMSARRIVLLVPPEVRDQLVTKDIKDWSRHFKVPVVEVVSYSQLSTASGAEILDKIKPDLIVADEVHRLKRRESARTKRFMRYMKENPECRLVALSGTITNRGLRDYSHIIELCLRKNSPLPAPYRELMEWADAIDVIREGEQREARAPGALMKLCDEGESVRSGFRRRLVETPGVVATTESAIGTSLYLRAARPEVPGAVTRALSVLENTWAIGDEELTDAMSVARVAKQISCGFYYVWKWPGGIKDHEWLEARSKWHRAVRDFLKHRSRKGLDSPLLVTNAVIRGDIPDLDDVYAAWERVKDRPEPPVEAVWIDKFLVDYAIQWCVDRADAKENGIVWFEHRAIEDALRATGKLRVFGAGQDAELGVCVAPIIACSIAAHGTGKNLQRWNRGLILSPPSSGTKIEQCLGRQHRPGQEADEVFFDVCLHTDYLRRAFESAEADARYVEETQGQKQKILYATRIGF